MRTLPLKLAPGSDLRLSIEKIVREENTSGFVLGVVGNLSKASFQCPGRNQPTVLEGNLEIITLNGTLSPSGVHLHLSLSDGDCQVWGGHLEPGTEILKGADVLLGLIDENPSLKSANNSSISKVETRVHVAVISGCPWCSRALRILKANDVPHSIQTIENDDDFDDLRKKPALSSFPQVFVDGVLIGGYDALEEINRSGRLRNLR